MIGHRTAKKDWKVLIVDDVEANRFAVRDISQ